MRVRWWGPREKPNAVWPRAESLTDLAHWSDALLVAARAVPDNSGLIDRAVLAALGPAGVLVNVSRGFIVDEGALLEGLGNGSIGGAALDVFTQEPPDPEPWRALDNVVLAPHLAGFTRKPAK